MSSTYDDYHIWGHGCWEPQVISFDTTWLDVTKRIIQGCGLDPTTATVQNLYDANPLIECTTCVRQDDAQFLTWWPVFVCGHWQSLESSLLILYVLYYLEAPLFRPQSAGPLIILWPFNAGHGCKSGLLEIPWSQMLCALWLGVR